MSFSGARHSLLTKETSLARFIKGLAFSVGQEEGFVSVSIILAARQDGEGGVLRGPSKGAIKTRNAL